TPANGAPAPVRPPEPAPPRPAEPPAARANDQPGSPWQGPPETRSSQTGPQPRPAYGPPPREGGPQHGAPSSDATRVFSAQRPERPASWPPPREGSGPGRQGGWQPAPRWQEPATPSTNWSYVDSIRSSELVPTRKPPPGRGWRRAVYKSTFGLVNLGQSPDELRLAGLESKIRSLLRGHYKIGVLGKGGVGKTTIAASVGSVFAELRQDDRVVAIDADTSFGKLGSRIDPKAQGSYWELASDQHLDTFADLRSRVGNN